LRKVFFGKCEKGENLDDLINKVEKEIKQLEQEKVQIY